MTKPLPQTPDVETIKEWRETRDLFKAAVGDSYDEQIEPYREVIRKQCGTLISPYRLLITMAGTWARMPEEKKMAAIAAAFDVHEEREPDLTEVEAQNLFTWSDGSPEFVRVETWIGEDKGIGAPHHVRLVLPDGSGFMLSKLEAKELCKMLMGAVRS